MMSLPYDTAMNGCSVPKLLFPATHANTPANTSLNLGSSRRFTLPESNVCTSRHPIIYILLSLTTQWTEDDNGKVSALFIDGIRHLPKQ